MNIGADDLERASTHRARLSHNPIPIFSEIWVACNTDTLPNMAQDVYSHLSEIAIPSRFLRAICNCTPQTMLPSSFQSVYSPTMNAELPPINKCSKCNSC